MARAGDRLFFAASRISIPRNTHARIEVMTVASLLGRVMSLADLREGCTGAMLPSADLPFLESRPTAEVLRVPRRHASALGRTGGTGLPSSGSLRRTNPGRG